MPINLLADGAERRHILFDAEAHPDVRESLAYPPRDRSWVSASSSTPGPRPRRERTGSGRFGWYRRFTVRLPLSAPAVRPIM
jgi:hypothetical protein